MPIIPIYVLEITKDVPFTCMIILYTIQLYKAIQKANKDMITVKEILILILLSLLVSLFRNNGIYAILMSLPVLAIIDKKNRKRLLLCIIIIYVLYKLFTSVLLPMLKIAPSSVREALSIPFQQTARYVKKYESEVTQEEKEAIDKILDYDILKEKYDPLSSDPVKNTYRKEATTEDLKNYLIVWCKQFIKHPTVYISATINNIYGYFYPESNIRQYTTNFIVDSHENINETGNFNYHYIEIFRTEREVIKEWANIATKIPGISWVINIGLNVWMVITISMYLIYIKKKKYLIYLLPIISLILVCIAAPINAYYRYAIPYIFAMPMTISIFIDILCRKNMV